MTIINLNCTACRRIFAVDKLFKPLTFLECYLVWKACNTYGNGVISGLLTIFTLHYMETMLKE